MSTNPSKRYGSPDVPKISNVNDDDVQQFQQIIRERKGMSFCLISPCLLFSSIIDVIIVPVWPWIEEGQLFCHSIVIQFSCSLLYFLYVFVLAMFCSNCRT